MTKYADTATELRTTLTERGIGEGMWGGFHWSTKMGGEHIRQAQVGDTTFELRIKAAGRGYEWSFERVEQTETETETETENHLESTETENHLESTETENHLESTETENHLDTGTHADTNKAAKRNDPDSPIIKTALAGHENESEILSVLAENPDYCSAISNGREISESTFSDGGLEVSEKTGFLNGLIKGIPYQAPTRTPAQWERYLQRCERDARIRGIEFAFTREGIARTQRKPRAKSRIDPTKAKTFRAKLA